MRKQSLPLLVIVFIGWLLYLNNVNAPTENGSRQHNISHIETVDSRAVVTQKQIAARTYIATNLENDIVNAIACVEGFRARPYYSGNWCVGYGSTQYIDGSAVTQYSHAVDIQEARQCVIAYLRRYIHPTIEKSVKRKLSDGEYVACAMFIYNVGSGAFEESSFLRLINAHANPQECAQKMALFNKAGGVVNSTLQKRRWLEGAIFCGYITPEDIKMSEGRVYQTQLADLYNGSKLNYSYRTVKKFLSNLS